MLEQFPQALKESRRWVCFDAAKTPINPATGQNAKPNDPATWGTLEAAQAAVSRFGLRGVGVILGDGLCGIDIDHCRDPDTGQLSDMAREIIDRMQTYAEESTCCSPAKSRPGPAAKAASGWKCTTAGGTSPSPAKC